MTCRTLESAWPMSESGLGAPRLTPSWHEERELSHDSNCAGAPVPTLRQEKMRQADFAVPSHILSLSVARSSCESLIRKLWNCVSKSVQVSLAYHVLIPPDGWSNGAQMPEAVRIDHTPDGRKIEELQAHGQDDPGDDETGPDGPGLAQLLITAEAEPRPQQVLHDANGNIGSHIIGIIPPPYGQVQHVSEV